MNNFLSSRAGQAAVLRQRAEELTRLADQIESGQEPSPRDLERQLELVNAEAQVVITQFYEADRHGTRLRQAEANLSHALALAKGAESRKAKQIKTTREALEAFNEWNAEKTVLRGTAK